MTDQIEHAPPPGDQIALVQLFLEQLRQMELRIGKKIDDNSGAAELRWRDHDREHHDLAKAVESIGSRLDAHLREEDDEELARNVRLEPIKRVSNVVVREWRTLAILGFLLLDFLASINDIAVGLFGHH